ncbi:MAG: DUF2238 domain-containing protein [Dinghuibacter sp.]|nr:DUF2238 domain-containing protein [Dinghuibacter sp.]
MFSTTAAPAQNRQSFLVIVYLALFLVYWLVCRAATTDLENFYIENILVAVAVALLAGTYRKFRFSNTSYTFIFLFLLLHIYGARYAYTANPLGDWLQQQFQFNRNPYDRLVHFSFGFLLAIPIRDFITNRLQIKGRTGWWLPVEMVLSLAAAFELVEWAVADIIFPAHGASYVATQGDIWDAQKDIFIAVAGAVLILCMARLWEYRKALLKRREELNVH